MKKEIYIVLFAFLGFLVNFLILALIETWYINHYMMDFSGMTYTIVSTLWLAIGMVFGFIDGKFFWQKIYVEKVRKGHVFKWTRKKR